MEQEFFITTTNTGPYHTNVPVGMNTVDGKEWVSLSGKEQDDFYWCWSQ